MKILSLILASALLPCLHLFGQVTVEVQLEQNEFLPGEALPVTVRIVNRSGQTLHLGNDPDWLKFSIESQDGFVVMKNGEAPVKGAFTLESSQMATKHVDLAPYFDITKPGRYTVTATLHIAAWNDQIPSRAKEFNIVDGAKIWSQQVGLPLPPGATNRTPEVRKFTLEQANYLRSQLRLYLCVTDASGNRIIKCVAIGPMVTFGQPEAQLDKSSNLYVLYQDGPRSFNYSVFNPDGERLIRQTYDYIGTRPRLQTDDQGNITVFGGRRRVAPTDVPKPKPADANTPSNP